MVLWRKREATIDAVEGEGSMHREAASRVAKEATSSSSKDGLRGEEQ